MDGASKGQTMSEDKRAEDLLSSSTIEMDQSAAQSVKSISSIGTSKQPSDPQTSAGSQTDNPEFVNHGKFAVIYKCIPYLLVLLFELLYLLFAGDFIIFTLACASIILVLLNI